MHTFIASALHASDPERRRIRLAERERGQRELEWQRRRRILPYL
jgi:hypothetical protein